MRFGYGRLCRCRREAGVVAGTADRGRKPTADGCEACGAEQDYRHACHPHQQTQGFIDLCLQVDLLYA